MLISMKVVREEGSDKYYSPSDLGSEIFCQIANTRNLDERQLSLISKLGIKVKVLTQEECLNDLMDKVLISDPWKNPSRSQGMSLLRDFKRGLGLYYDLTYETVNGHWEKAKTTYEGNWIDAIYNFTDWCYSSSRSNEERERIMGTREG